METQHRLKFLTSVISCGMAPMWNALFVRRGKVKREEKRCVKKKSVFGLIITIINCLLLLFLIIQNSYKFWEREFDPSSNYK